MPYKKPSHSLGDSTRGLCSVLVSPKPAASWFEATIDFLVSCSRPRSSASEVKMHHGERNFQGLRSIQRKKFLSSFYMCWHALYILEFVSLFISDLTSHIQPHCFVPMTSRYLLRYGVQLVIMQHVSRSSHTISTVDQPFVLSHNPSGSPNASQSKIEASTWPLWSSQCRPHSVLRMGPCPQY